MLPCGSIPTKFLIGRVRDLFVRTGLDGTNPVPPLKTQTRFAFWFLHKSDTTSQSAFGCQLPWKGSLGIEHPKAFPYEGKVARRKP